jgi:HAD superfamily hydrolase (TIGR01549 family)
LQDHSIGETAPRFKAILFDLDGTLVEFKFDVKASRRAMISWLSQRDFDTSGLSELTRTQTIIDEAARQCDSKGNDKENFESIRHSLSDVLDEFEIKAFEEAKPQVNALKTLESLRNHHVLEAIVTNSGRTAVNRIIDKYGFSKYVEFVLTRNEMGALKPNPEGIEKALKLLGLGNSDVAYVGDSTIDIEAARNAGITSIAVASGIYNHQVLAKSAPDYLIPDIKDVEVIVFPESN